MSAGKASSKFIMTLGLLVSVVVAGTYSDLRFNSNEFMFEEESIVELLDEDNSLRNVASAERELPSAQYIAYNSENRSRLDGKWLITSIHNTNNTVIYSKDREEDKNMKIEVTLEMIGTSLIRIDKDKGLDFDISFMHESGKRLALFRTMDNGYEVVELRKVDKKKKARKAQRVELAERKEEKKPTQLVKRKTGVNLDKDVDLVLERALDPKRNKDVLMGDKISGTLSVLGGNIENMEVTIHQGTDKEVSISIPFVKINDGGQFNFEAEGGMVSGLITNNGKEGYRIRFATGAFAGAMLNFVTDGEYQKLMELQEELAFEKELLREEQAMKAEEARERAEEAREEAIANGTLKVEEDQSQGRNKYEEYEEKLEEESEEVAEMETEAEMVQAVERSGFNFASGRAVPMRALESNRPMHLPPPAPKRDVASQR